MVGPRGSRLRGMKRASSRALILLSGALLFLQCALVVTGGAVRLTDSGLGCPTWPECTPGSYFPVPNQAEGQLHAWIEFGNRLLTFLLLFAAIATLIAVIKSARKDLRLLAIGQVLGILGQGVLGGITVLTNLNPASVASHFLLSMILIAGATSIFMRRNESFIKVENQDKRLMVLSKIHLALTAIVLISGTIVTGSGPHAGDADAPRFNIEIQSAAMAHGGAVVLLIALTIYFLLQKSASKLTKKSVRGFLHLSFAQGLIGYIQYLTGVPQLLVATHLLGSVLVWIFAWRIWLSVTYTQKEKADQ